MKFIKVAMVTPTEQGVYAPSRLKPGARQVSAQVETSEPVVGLVSFAPDGKSNPVEMNLYGFGLDCWYVCEEDI